MMIEPPGNFGRTGVLEVDDGVLIAIELLLVEQRPGSVDQAGEDEFGIAANAFAVETGKQRGGTSSVKTFVVIENANSQESPQSHNRFPPAENHAAGVGLGRG
jgi:hypothetical protein